MFSVIIPIYNCENYLKECLDSVLNQTNPDWECICINDGSSDRSGEIADSYAAQDTRFQVVHKPNGGEGSARNAGLEVCIGEWVYFLDSDDVLNRRTLEICQHAITNNPNAELISVGMTPFADGILPKWKDDEPISWLNIDISQKIYSRTFGIHVWTTAYRKSMIQNMRFSNLKVAADRVFVIEALDSATNVVLCNYIGYGYRTRPGSIVNSKMTPEKFLADLHHRMICLNYFVDSAKNYDKALFQRFQKDFTEYMSYCFFKMSMEDQKKTIEKWANAMNSASKQYKWNSWYMFVMRAFGKTKSRVVIWGLGFLPFWLKQHGVNRQFSIHKNA